MKKLVIYHANCIDGYTAAWAAWLSEDWRGAECGELWRRSAKCRRPGRARGRLQLPARSAAQHGRFGHVDSAARPPQDRRGRLDRASGWWVNLSCGDDASRSYLVAKGAT